MALRSDSTGSSSSVPGLAEEVAAGETTDDRDVNKATTVVQPAAINSSGGGTGGDGQHAKAQAETNKANLAKVAQTLREDASEGT